MKRKWLIGMLVLVLVLGVCGCSSPAAKTTEQKTNSSALDEEIVYIDKLIAQNNGWAKAFKDFRESGDPGLESTASVDALNEALDEMTALVEDAREINPPKGFEEVHDLFLKGIDELEEIPLKVPKAIAEGDFDTYSKLGENITKGLDYMNEATILSGEIIN